MIYALYKTKLSEGAYVTLDDGSFVSFQFDPANTDYANFKKEVLAGAELQDADGNVMTQEQANAFIGTLP
jgi:hypothetical protein